MKKFLLTMACTIGFATLALAEPFVLPEAYIRGDINGWKAEDSYKFKYTGDINNPTTNQNGEYEMTVYLDILAYEFKIGGITWDDFNYGAKDVNNIVTGNCTKEAWHTSSEHFILNDMALKEVTLTFYYKPNENPSYLKIEGTEVPLASVTVAAPTFSVAEGAVYEGTTVVLTTETEGATIYYTTGESPSFDETWTQYEGRTIAINEPTTIKAIAVKKGMLNSDVATASYTILTPNIPITDGATSATFNFGTTSGLKPEVNAPTADAEATDISSKFFKNEVVTIAVSGNKGNQNNPRLWYDASNGIDMRLYAAQYFTVSVPEGYILGDITFTHYDTGKMDNLNCGGIGTYTVNATDSKEATWTCKMGDKVPYSTVENVTFTATDDTFIQTITVEYKTGTPTGVDNIAVDDENAPAVYYNLQGVRVDNPGPGLYIVRRGNTATKTLVR